MDDDGFNAAVRRALLALRATLGLFLLQWGVEKFVVPENTVGIWGHFYGMQVSETIGYLFGAIEIALALCLFLGIFRTVAYGAALAIHAVTVAVTWRQLTSPWSNPINHLFLAAVPVLGGFIALFLLRRWDRGVLDRGVTSDPAVG
ncbi:MAG TPA: DoxX family membrane protein [Gemmatimonadales bacterium]|nr:DoxX family membrane protein [Gemmatimonadales bacterium]